MSIGFTADSHFGHARRIELCNRPFADLAEMNGAMIAAWNAVVRPDDEVWHLDNSCYKSARPPVSIFNALNGRKNLIVGNHDEEADGRTDRRRLDEACQRSRTQPLRFSGGHRSGPCLPHRADERGRTRGLRAPRRNRAT